jgi:hypothetical protein
MIDELEYNISAAERLVLAVAQGGTFGRAAASFRDSQFDDAISQGAISLLADDLRGPILSAYAVIGELRQLVVASMHQSLRDQTGGYTNTQEKNTAEPALKVLADARKKLLEYLSRDE